MAWSEISLFRESPVSRLLRRRLVRPVASLLNLIVSQQQGIPLLEVIGTVGAVAGNADMRFIPQQGLLAMGLGGEPAAQRVTGSMLEKRLAAALADIAGMDFALRLLLPLWLVSDCHDEHSPADARPA